MKYIYYIVAIVVVFSVIVGYGMFNPNVQVSKPVIVINDRIISETEYAKLLERQPVYMTEDQYVESVIMNELFIQEAIRQEINTEEDFRQSVENFYEQSLVKLLLDRQFKSFQVDVSDADIQKYQQLLKSRITLIKTVYPMMKEGKDADVKPSINRMTSDFQDLSDVLKYTVFTLEPGQSTDTRGEKAGKEFETSSVVYKLETIDPLPDTGTAAIGSMDLQQIREFITDMKKEEMLEQWTGGLRQDAHIWRK